MGMNTAEIEGRGRIVIPKSIRQELELRPGQKVIIEKRDREIVIRPTTNVESLTKLKGCVKKSKLNPLGMKSIWK